MVENNELYHFGVKGMKWGVRKKRDRTPIERLRSTASASKMRKLNINYVNQKGQIRSRGQLLGHRIGIQAAIDVGGVAVNRMLMSHGREKLAGLQSMINPYLSFASLYDGVKEQVQYRSALEKSHE